MRNINLLITLLFFFLSCSWAFEKIPDFDDDIKHILNSHYLAYKDKEYFTGISLSVYIPHQAIKNYYIGQEAQEKGSKKIDADTLFEIGSITKSFTAAIVLQLEKENKLHLQDTLAEWLPTYRKWSHLTIQTLLNMTSGLPNYSDAALMNVEEFYHPERQWSEKQLINFVYPPGNLSPPLKPGYSYTNTGYILTGMMIEKATRNSFQKEIEERLIKPAHLSDTFYPIPSIDKKVAARLAHGYGYNPYTNPELVGKDMQKSNLSWAGAAGALISNSVDVIKWIRALFVDNSILDQNQKKQLMQIVSTATGEPIQQTSSANPRAFGLGVSEGFDKDFGRYWFYEGETEGFRALYMYVPSNGIIIACIFNSAVNAENDHAGELMKKIYLYTKKNMTPNRGESLYV